MANLTFQDIMKMRSGDTEMFNFDNLAIPPMYCYLTPQDIDALYKIATSLRLNSKIMEKRKLIANIMTQRGFKYMGAGTNRIVYRHLEDPRFVAKIATDRVGLGDNAAEYKNQFLLKPYVTKMFEVSPNGVVGFAERVQPILTNYEFASIADQVYDIITMVLIQKYVVGDIGTNYFMNWGCRLGGTRFGPVLLDYPYVYPTSNKKIYCAAVDPATNIPCNGKIDYDAGFNHLRCTKCGKLYSAKDLEDETVGNTLVIEDDGGNKKMRVYLMKGDQVLAASEPETTSVIQTKTKEPEPNKKLKVSLILGKNVSNETKQALGITDDMTEPVIISNFNESEEVKEKKEEKKEEVKSVVEEVPAVYNEPVWPSLALTVSTFRSKLEEAGIPNNLHDDIIDDFENEFIRTKNEYEEDDGSIDDVINMLISGYLRRVIIAQEAKLKIDDFEEVKATIDDAEEEEDQSMDQTLRPSKEAIEKTRADMYFKFMQYYRTRKKKIDFDLIEKAQDEAVGYYTDNFTNIDDDRIMKDKISEIFNRAINNSKNKSKFISQ